MGTVAGFPRPQLGVPGASPPPSSSPPVASRTATVIGIGTRLAQAGSDSGRLPAVQLEAPSFTKKPSPPPPAPDDDGRDASPKPSTLRPPAAPDTEHVTVIRLPGAAGARFTQPPERAAKPAPGSDPPRSGRPRSDPPNDRPRSDPPNDRPRSDPPHDRPRSDPPEGFRSSDRPREGAVSEAARSDPPSPAPASDRPIRDASVPPAASAEAKVPGATERAAPKLAGWKERRQRGHGSSAASRAEPSRESAEHPRVESSHENEQESRDSSARPASGARFRRPIPGMSGLSSKKLALYVVLFLLMMTGTTIGLTLLLL